MKPLLAATLMAMSMMEPAGAAEPDLNPTLSVSR